MQTISQNPADAAAELLRCFRDAVLAMPPRPQDSLGYRTAITYFAPTNVVREFARLTGGELNIHDADREGRRIVATSHMLLGAYCSVQGDEAVEADEALRFDTVAMMPVEDGNADAGEVAR